RTGREHSLLRRPDVARHGRQSHGSRAPRTAQLSLPSLCSSAGELHARSPATDSRHRASGAAQSPWFCSLGRSWAGGVAATDDTAFHLARSGRTARERWPADRSLSTGATTMQMRRLGSTGLTIAPLALGTVNFSWLTDEAESFAIMDKAFERGINFF